MISDRGNTPSSAIAQFNRAARFLSPTGDLFSGRPFVTVSSLDDGDSVTNRELDERACYYYYGLWVFDHKGSIFYQINLEKIQVRRSNDIRLSNECDIRVNYEIS